MERAKERVRMSPRLTDSTTVESRFVGEGELTLQCLWDSPVDKPSRQLANY